LHFLLQSGNFWLISLRLARIWQFYSPWENRHARQSNVITTPAASTSSCPPIQVSLLRQPIPIEHADEIRHRIEARERDQAEKLSANIRRELASEKAQGEAAVRGRIATLTGCLHRPLELIAEISVSLRKGLRHYGRCHGFPFLMPYDAASIRFLGYKRLARRNSIGLHGSLYDLAEVWWLRYEEAVMGEGIGGGGPKLLCLFRSIDICLERAPARLIQ
jgi:hypothetical protein